MFVAIVRTVRLRYAFTQIVMVRSHFHCWNTVPKYWYFSETSRSFQVTSHPTQAANGGGGGGGGGGCVTWKRWSGSSIYNKNDANNIFSGWYKIGFEIKNEIEGQCQSSPKLTGILTVLRCSFCINLEILAGIGGESWHGQAQNMVFFYF